MVCFSLFRFSTPRLFILKTKKTIIYIFEIEEIFDPPKKFFPKKKSGVGAHASIIEQLGASVAIIATATPPFAEALFKSEGITEIQIPVFLITFADATTLLSAIGANAALSSPTTLTLVPEDNDWIDLAQGGFWIFLEVVLLLSCIFFFAVSLRGLVLFIKEDGFNYSLPQVLHWVNMLACLFLSMVVFDPWNVRFIVDHTFFLSMLALSRPPFLTSVVLLSFFFSEGLFFVFFL